MGDDARRWKTFPGKRTLVTAARTVTSAVRLLEVLPALLHSDPRVDVVFACDPGSAFGNGVPDLIRAAGARMMPWDQLSRITCKLIFTASENLELPDVDCPVLVLPHGVGFHKLVPDARGTGRRLSGVMDDARAWHTVSHPDQLCQLDRYHPSLSARTRMVGDPCYDRLLASSPLRDRYRKALGLRDGQRLVVVSSTWGEQSLLGTDPGLPARLVGALPLDEYRVAAVAHPNVWAAHGAYQVRLVEAAALRGGLLLVPPERGWQAALIAADAVIGDHGSVTLYGAALGKPVLLAAFGEESVPDTPLAELSRIAPRLDPHGPLAAQVEQAIAEHDTERTAKVAGGAFAEPGHALERLRTTFYELLGLPEPTAAPPPLHAWPEPSVERREVTTMSVRTLVTEEDGEWTVTVHRRPGAGPAPEDSGAEFHHLSCDDGETDLRLRPSASVFTSRESAGSAVEAVRRARERLAELRGLRLMTVPVPGGWLTVLRDGRIVESTATGPLTDPGLIAAVAYACLRTGHPLTGTVTLRAGEREEDVTLRVRPRAP